MKTYVGLADCHGIEYFAPKETKTGGGMNLFTFCCLRADLNRQRHAVPFVAVLTNALIRDIERELKKRDFIKALKILKTAKIVKFPNRIGYQKSWSLIPDSRLDPWSD